MESMTIFDENQHPRGQADNAGQFRDKENSGPESALAGTGASFPEIVDLDTWEPGEDVDADALIRDELERYRAAYAKNDTTRTPEQIADSVLNHDQWMALEKDGADASWVRRLVEQAAREGQLDSSSTPAPRSASDFLASVSRDYYESGKLVELATAKRLAELVLGHYPTAAYMELEESDQESGGFWNAGIYDVNGDEIENSDENPDSIAGDVDMLCQTLPTRVPSDYDSAASNYVEDPDYAWLRPFSGGRRLATTARLDLVAAAKIDLGS